MKEILEEFGFTNYEAQIYLCLLENGKLSAYAISEKTGLYRQAIYDAMNRMQEKSYVSSIHEGRKQLFQACDPQFLLGELQQKTNALQDILPNLLTLKQTSKDPVNVQLFQGRGMLRLAFDDIIKTLKEQGGENVCTAVDELAFLEEDKILVERYERAMINNKFKERVLIKEGTKGLISNKVTKYRYIPEKYFNSNPIQIYGDRVQIWLSGQPMHMILIQNQEIANSFRKQFELMWSVAMKI